VCDPDLLGQRFETHREHLGAVALRMLRSSHEADDAVQEAWLRLSRTDAGAVGNLGGWLTTVVARLCLDMLRARATKRGTPRPWASSTWNRCAAPAAARGRQGPADRPGGVTRQGAGVRCQRTRHQSAGRSSCGRP
jgi:DNA-directed RNA polymerase specialized sigma24 family protein